jgi:hypothetical protein
MARFFRDLGRPETPASDGAELLEEPTEAFWGGGFSWRDPEGNNWDVAWAREATIDERGGVTFP